MKHFQKIILSIMALTLLIGSIAFTETGHFLFGLLMIAAIVVAVLYVGFLFGELDTYEKLTDAYKEAEVIYKDSLKSEREYMEKLNGIVSDTLKHMEHMNGAQVELNDFLKETLVARRMDNITIAAGYENLQKKISRSMKTNTRKR